MLIYLDKFFFCLIYEPFLMFNEIVQDIFFGGSMRLIVYILLLGMIVLTGAQFFKDYGNADAQKSFMQAKEMLQEQELKSLDASVLGGE